MTLARCSIKLLAAFLTFMALIAGVQPALSQSAPDYDTIISAGQIVDGTGKAAYDADIGIKDGIIKKIGNLQSATAARRIDASGRIVSPGFIDIHSHADDYNGAKEGIRSDDIRRRQALNIITQGVTTIVVNPDGFATPGMGIAQQRSLIEKGGVGLNVALMIAHNAVRSSVLKDDHRRLATPEELAEMKALAKQGMEDGAFGLSSGLEYIPGRWSNIDEVTALMEVIAPYGGVHISHMRSETTAPMWWLPSQDEANPPQLLDSVSEIISIAERTKSRGVVTHIKVRGTTHWGQSVDVIKLVEDAQARGVEIYGDQYPYNSSGSDGHIVFIPDWVFGFGPALEKDYGQIDLPAKLKAVLSDNQKRDALYGDIRHVLAFRGGPDNIKVFDYPDESFIGKTLAEFASAKNTSVEDLIISLQLEGYTDRPGGARLRSFSLHDDDMVRLMQKDWVATASDGGIALPEDGPAVHARYYGTFPRKLGHFSRDRGIVSLEKAVRSITGLPAEILGLKTRGVITEGMVADITIFDSATISDTSTFTDPHQYSVGIDEVLIGGKPIMEAGKPNGALIGKVLWAQKD